MKKAFLLFPHQLFKDNLSVPKDHLFYLVEDALYFSQYRFHKQKLMLHRATIKYHQKLLEDNGYQVRYVSFYQVPEMNHLFEILAKEDIKEIHIYDLTDDWLEQRLRGAASTFQMQVKERSTPMFLSTREYLSEYFTGRKTFFMADFYMAQRKKLNILMEGKKPSGGKWSFDTENRKKLPKGVMVPETWFPGKNKFTEEAEKYVNQHFPDNHGESSSFHYAITHEDAERCLHNFLEERFADFGIYEDAISSDHVFLFHSVLTPYLNTGLLTPLQVLEAVMTYEGKVPLNSLEGYIRQIIGWREYMRAVYLLKGRRDRTKNFWDHQKKIPYEFWTADTGIKPVDSTIKKVLKNGYTHHIERLMVMGNFMLLCEYAPDEIYRWFMEMYIDAYDWVMVPNVYSMSQYAGGGTTTTKPYISSSNYILKMSDFKKGDWADTWDALYWRFIHKHQGFFNNNPRLSMMVLHLNKMDAEKINSYYSSAEKYLDKFEQLKQDK